MKKWKSNALLTFYNFFLFNFFLELLFVLNLWSQTKNEIYCFNWPFWGNILYFYRSYFDYLSSNPKYTTSVFFNWMCTYCTSIIELNSLTQLIFWWNSSNNQLISEFNLWPSGSGYVLNIDDIRSHENKYKGLSIWL